MTVRAMILAAGRGERLRPLTDSMPKPLLQVGRHRLIEWHLLALARAGITEVVVNTAWLEEQFPAALGDGSRYGVRIVWSHEGASYGKALETAGGIRKALDLLDEVFWVVSADVFLPGFRFQAGEGERLLESPALAHLWMVPNPPHHHAGDFPLSPDGMNDASKVETWTWASVGLFKAAMFRPLVAGQVAPLRPLLDSALAEGRLQRTPLAAGWVDVGTADRLRIARSWADAERPAHR